MLTVRDRMTLALCEVQPRRVRYERAMVEVGLTPAKFAGRVVELLENPEAAAEYPQLVARQRRLKEKRRVARAGSRLSGL